MEMKQHLTNACMNAPGSPGTRSGTTSCEVCKQLFARSTNSKTACASHPGKLVYLHETDETRHWDCCQKNEENLGCQTNWHVDAFRPIECEFCKVKIQAQDLQKHITEDCQKTPNKAPVECEYCAKVIPKEDLNDHYQEVCPLYPSVLCPNAQRGCPEKMLRNEIKFHIKNCLFRDSQCPFRDFGCSATFFFSNTDNHMREAVSIHSNILLDQVLQLTKSVASLQQENKELRSLLSSSSSSLPLTSSSSSTPKDLNVNVEEKAPDTKDKDKETFVGKLTQTFEQIESTRLKAENTISPKKSAGGTSPFTKGAAPKGSPEKEIRST